MGQFHAMTAGLNAVDKAMHPEEHYLPSEVFLSMFPVNINIKVIDTGKPHGTLKYTNPVTGNTYRTLVDRKTLELYKHPKGVK